MKLSLVLETSSGQLLRRYPLEMLAELLKEYMVKYDNDVDRAIQGMLKDIKISTNEL